jgi:broad specificity phosphatase PhoE
MPETTRVLLSRHAHPLNPERVFYGHLPGFGLSPLGVAQAHAIGEFAATLPVRRIYTSPLQRARETADLVASHLPAGVPVEVREELVETRFGKYIQGVRQAEVMIRRPLWWVHMVRPGTLEVDETVEAMAARVEGVVREAAAACEGAAAMVVSHADPIKAFWNRHLGRADWRFHFLRLAKGGLLDLGFDGDRLARVDYHPPLQRGPETEPDGTT